MTDTPQPNPPTGPILVVGGTGHLGGLVIDELLALGKQVRALVRPATDPARLEAKGVEIARGDMLDLDSLVTAMTGADAVITTAAGYTRRSKQPRTSTPSATPTSLKPPPRPVCAGSC